MASFVRWLLIGLGILIGLVMLAFVTFFVIRPEVLRLRDDPRHAASVFDGVVPYEAVLETRCWHRRGVEHWDCSFAIVELSDDAPPDPPEPTEGREWYRYYGGDWQPTPAAPLGDTTRDALDFCGQYWSETLNSALDSAMTQPGSWYARDRVGETLHLYSAPQRIAARIRYGD